MEHVSEEVSEDVQSQSLFERLQQSRWAWLGATVVLLVLSGIMLANSLQVSARQQSELAAAEKSFAENVAFVERSGEITDSLAPCVEMVTTRIQQLDTMRIALSTISNEYRNMYHSGIRNVDVDSYSAALNSFAAAATVLDSQDLEACDAK